ncbi:MAG: RNA polymerase factor sigma-54 [Anaerolineae bacterium]|nr:RNA polymerase factor sigma-54 [Anaerolineae bacterium]
MYFQTTVDVQPSITPQAIIANTLLQMSAAELEQAVSEALAENPALEMPSPIVCPRCGSPLANGTCPLCTAHGRNATIRRDDEGWWNEDSRWQTRNVPIGEEEDFDPLALVAAETTLADHLQLQVAPLLEPGEEEVATFIIDSLDERGYFTLSLEETAHHLGCDTDLVERVLAKIQSLDPPGVGARSVQECLLIQLAQLENPNGHAAKARRMISECWDSLSRLSLDAIARQLKYSESEISEAIEFIGRNLNPFPANANWSGPGPRHDSTAVRPDIIVRRRPSDGTYEIEIPDSRKYRLRVNGLYQQMARDLRAGNCRATFGEAEHLREHLAQARLFINCVRQRWQTLERIALVLVDLQEDFLEKGYRYLKPLTRSELADIVGVHESTVGRAVANKSIMLPNGRIIPLSDMFDGSLAVKCVIEEIVLQESEPLSDQRIADLLQQRGYDIARRTVAKYRDAVGIPPARVRSALRTRAWRPLWVPPEHAQAF